MSEPVERYVWKYPIKPLVVVQEIEMPRLSRIVMFNVQRHEKFGMIDETPTIWAAVYPEYETVTRRFQIITTGLKIPVFGQHVGSCISEAGLALHLYEIT